MRHITQASMIWSECGICIIRVVSNYECFGKRWVKSKRLCNYMLTVSFTRNMTSTECCDTCWSQIVEMLYFYLCFLLRFKKKQILCTKLYNISAYICSFVVSIARAGGTFTWHDICKHSEVHARVAYIHGTGTGIFKSFSSCSHWEGPCIFVHSFLTDESQPWDVFMTF